MPPKRKKLLVGIFSGIVLVFGVVVLALFVIFLAVRKEPSSQESPGIALPPPNLILVTITNPAEGGIFPLNGSVPVLVELASEQPLQGIRFWLDGVEIGAVLPDVPAVSARFDFPSTLLKGEGWHTLYAGAVDQTGRVTLSNVVHVKSSPPVGMETIYVAKEGDTLDSIAAAFQADPNKIQTRNPGWSGGAGDPLPAGKTVIIPFDPPPAPPQAEPASEGAQLQFGSSLPRPPSIQALVDQCLVSLTLQDLAKDASGFILYRLDANGGLFIPIASFDGSQVSPLVYQDETAAGAVQYIASVYNDQGESLGDPVAVALTNPGCADPSTLPVSGSVLSLPPSSNGIYFYTSIDGNGYERYPASNGEFLSLKDGTFDLRGLTSSGGGQTIPSGVAVEAWGWDSGGLSFLGQAQARIEIKPRLRICPIGTICGGSEGIQYSESAVVGSDQENQLRGFRWEIVSPLAESYSSVLFQLSLQPFSAGAQEDPPGLAYSKVLSGAVSSENTVWGTFNLNFKDLGDFFATPADRTADFAGILVNQSESPYPYNPWLTSQYEKNNPNESGLIFLQYPDANLVDGFLNIPLTYYARIIPLSGGKLIQSPSNVVTIEYKPTGTNAITIPPKTSSIYDIEILSSAAPIPPSAHWGCVDVIAVNPNSWVWTAYGSWFKDRLPEFEGYLNNHTPYCPAHYVPEEKAWYEDLWDWVNEALQDLNKIYQAAKKLSIDSMLAQYDLIGGWKLCPLPDCRDKVFDGLMKGQEWVLKYQYGLPADIPDLNQLTDEGIEALAEQALKYAGLDGDACPKEVLDCKKLLVDAIHTLKDEFVKQTVASYQDDAIAHGNGYYALMMPTDPTAITVRPAITQNWQMAEATIRVTRKAGGTSFTEQELSKLNFVLYVNVHAVNETCRNMTYYYCVDWVTTGWGPGQCNQQPVVLGDAPCEGDLFSGYKIIPLLAPGESREFTIKLLPQPYWVPEMPEEFKVYNPEGDFDLLYLDAQAEISARLWSNSPYMTEAYDGPDPFTTPVLNPSGLLGGY